MERALITGMTGFVGSHLAEFLLAEGLEVWGTHFKDDLNNISAVKDKVKVLNVDMRDSAAVEKAVQESQPDFIFHLAAQSYPPLAWKFPAETMKINVTGCIYLFEAVKKLGIDPTMQVAGSSEQYGMFLPEELPLWEYRMG